MIPTLFQCQETRVGYIFNAYTSAHRSTSQCEYIKKCPHLNCKHATDIGHLRKYEWRDV